MVFQAFDLYSNLAQQLKMYEGTLFSQWQNKSIPTITSTLKKNILKVVKHKMVTGKY